jgi:hypothetical protein
MGNRNSNPMEAYTRAGPFDWVFPFESFTCEEKLKSLNECMHTALGVPYPESLSNHKCSKFPLHLHLMIDNIDQLDERCRDTMPNVFRVREKMGRSSYYHDREMFLTGSAQVTFLRVAERHSRYSQHRDEIFRAIASDVIQGWKGRALTAEVTEPRVG